MLSPFTGTLGTPEHLAWIEDSRALQAAYHRRQSKWRRKIGLPWPRKPSDVRPPPGELELDADDDG